MKIKLAQHAGFCFGVERAAKIALEELAEMPRPVRIFGHLVHNEQVMEKLFERGIIVVDSIRDIYDGTLIITAHGISPRIKKELLMRPQLVVVDTSCPKVLKVQALAMNLCRKGYKVIIIGDKYHQEVLGINGAANDQAIVINNLEEIEDDLFDKDGKIGVVVQTTQEVEKVEAMRKQLEEKFSNVDFFDTICDATRFRQKEVRSLAERNNVMLVVGSKTSANTTRLYEVCIRINPHTYFIATDRELKNEWFDGCQSVGIAAGASTPWWVIEKVMEKVRKI